MRIRGNIKNKFGPMGLFDGCGFCFLGREKNDILPVSAAVDAISVARTKSWGSAGTITLALFLVISEF